jgi:EpsI family protein
MMRTVVAFLFLALNFYVYNYFAAAEVLPSRTPLTQFPLRLGEWRCPGRESMGTEAEQTLGITDYLMCTYAKPGTQEFVGVYLGYNATQVRSEGGGNAEHMIHPPAHCLPGSGWDIIAARKVTLDLPGLPVRPAYVNRLVIAKGDARQLVYYWYQERGRVIADDWRKIVDLFWDRATRHRSDGSLIRFTVPLARGDEKHAEQSLRDLAEQIVPLLPSYVPN